MRNRKGRNVIIQLTEMCYERCANFVAEFANSPEPSFLFFWYRLLSRNTRAIQAELKRRIRSKEMFETKTVARCVPHQFSEAKWQKFTREEQVGHLIVSICNEIVDAAANEICERYLKRKSFEFTSQCLRTIWLRVFNASIDNWIKLLNIESCWKAIFQLLKSS